MQLSLAGACSGRKSREPSRLGPPPSYRLLAQLFSANKVGDRAETGNRLGDRRAATPDLQQDVAPLQPNPGGRARRRDTPPGGRGAAPVRADLKSYDLAGDDDSSRSLR